MFIITTFIVIVVLIFEGKNTPLKYTFQMAVFKMGLQRPNEDECFTSSVSMALPHC